MTLNILWRSEGRLHMASDSRMSFPGNGDADVGVKVMRLPIRILGANDDPEGKADFEALLDASYAGSLANAATFGSLVEDIMLDGQYICQDVPLSFDVVCQVLCRFSEKISTKVVAALAEKGRFTFLLAGWCPLTNSLRGAEFTLAQDAGQSKSTYEEVAINEGDYVAVGTGTDAFKATLGDTPVSQRSVLLALNTVIDSKAVDTVGGDLQYGSFDSCGNFKVACINRVSMEKLDDVDGKQYEPTQWRAFKFRGFDLYAGWKPEDGFFPSPLVIELEVPSNDESQAAFAEHCRKTTAGVG
jgi:hypothetical protein